MDKPKRKGALDSGNEEDLELLISVWCCCIGLVLVVLYLTGAIK